VGNRDDAVTPHAQAERVVLSTAVLQIVQAITEGLSRVSTSRPVGPAAVPDRPTLVDLAEAARLLGVSRMTMTRLCDQGRVPCVVVRRGRRQQLRRIPRAFIEAVASDALSAGGQVDLKDFAAAWLARSTLASAGEASRMPTADAEVSHKGPRP
jgi:excisionase family DNA binding protein